MVRGEDVGLLLVTGAHAGVIAELATAYGITLHELSPQAASVEDVFMELTRESVDYHGVTRVGADTPTLRSR